MATTRSLVPKWPNCQSIGGDLGIFLNLLLVSPATPAKINTCRRQGPRSRSANRIDVTVASSHTRRHPWFRPGVRVHRFEFGGVIERYLYRSGTPDFRFADFLVPVAARASDIFLCTTDRRYGRHIGHGGLPALAATILLPHSWTTCLPDGGSRRRRVDWRLLTQECHNDLSHE